MQMTAAQFESFMREPNVAVLSTVRPDGTPHQAPLWHLWEDGIAYIFTARRSQKWRNLERNAEASLCIDRNEVPYAYVVLQGTAAESDRPLLDVVERMAEIYYEPDRAADLIRRYRDPRPDTVLIAVTPRRITSWLQPDSD